MSSKARNIVFEGMCVCVCGARGADSSKSLEKQNK